MGTRQSVVLSVNAYQQGTNLGRLEGFRLVVQALGGTLEKVEAEPDPQIEDDNGLGWWHLSITLHLPQAGQARCTVVAEKMFDGTVEVTAIGTREEPDDDDDLAWKGQKC